MTAEAETTSTTTASKSRRHDTGTVRLSQRDIDGLLLCGEHYAFPSDLLAQALGVNQDRLYTITSRWRRAGYLDTNRLGPRPTWYWLTPKGMTATGPGFPATRPAKGAVGALGAPTPAS